MPEPMTGPFLVLVFFAALFGDLFGARWALSLVLRFERASPRAPDSTPPATR